MAMNKWYDGFAASIRDTPEYQAERVLLDIEEQILRQMDRQGTSRAGLARSLGVSRPFVTRLLNGNPNLTVKTIARVALSLGLNVEVTLTPKHLMSLRSFARRRLLQEEFTIEDSHISKMPEDVSALAA